MLTKTNQAVPRMRGVDPEAEAVPAGVPSSSATLTAHLRGVTNAAAGEGQEEVGVDHPSARRGRSSLQLASRYGR